MVVAKPKGDNNRRVSTKSCSRQNASDDARLVLDGVGHTAGQSVEPRSRQHAERDAKPTRTNSDREDDGTLEAHQSFGRTWA